MTFDAIQQGTQQQSVEMYEFFHAGRFIRVTSAANSQFIGANEFVPLVGLKRTGATISNETDSGTINIDCISSFEVALDYRNAPPSQNPSVTVFRRENNDPDAQVVTVFSGTIVSCVFPTTSSAQFKCFPPTRIFAREIPRAVYAGTCNNQLFDQGCKVSESAFTSTPVPVTSIDSSGLIVTFAGLRTAAEAIVSAQGLTVDAAHLDNFYQRGLISTLNSPAELRMVVDANVGGDPNTIRVSVPFAGVSVGTLARVSAGCTHSSEYCNTGFDNIINFGGYPFVPLLNVFNIEFDSGREIRPPGTDFSRFRFGQGGTSGGAPRNFQFPL